jgi:hypothetical protein
LASDYQPKSRKKWAIAVAAVVLIALSLAGLYGLAILFRPRSIPVPHFIVSSGLAVVDSGSYRDFQFHVYRDVASQNVEGDFSVSGSDGNGIRVYIRNDTSFVNWKNGNAFSTYYDSGIAVNGSISVLPPPGTYHLVLDNTFSAASKNVTVTIANVVVPV